MHTEKRLRAALYTTRANQLMHRVETDKSRLLSQIDPNSLPPFSLIHILYTDVASADFEIHDQIQNIFFCPQPFASLYPSLISLGFSILQAGGTYAHFLPRILPASRTRISAIYTRARTTLWPEWRALFSTQGTHAAIMEFFPSSASAYTCACVCVSMCGFRLVM